MLLTHILTENPLVFACFSLIFRLVLEGFLPQFSPKFGLFLRGIFELFSLILGAIFRHFRDYFLAFLGRFCPVFPCYFDKNPVFPFQKGKTVLQW